jgi:hypothetical protein
MTDPYSDPLARDLAALAPKPTAVTSAAVLFAAGQQAAELKANRWRMVSSGLVVLFIASWVGWTLRPEQPMPSYSISGMANQSSSRTHETSPEPGANPTISKPIPQVLIVTLPDEATLDERIRGIRLRHDILAGGLGLIPDAPKGERPRLPSDGSMDMNPSVLGGHYSPKKDD